MSKLAFCLSQCSHVKGNKYTHALRNDEVFCFAIINSLSTETRQAGPAKQLFTATSAALTWLQVKYTLVLFQLLLTYAPYLNLQPGKNPNLMELDSGVKVAHRIMS